MRIPRLNSDFVFLKSDAAAIGYPKKTLSTLVSAALLAVCCTSMAANWQPPPGSVLISNGSEYIYEGTDLSGDQVFIPSNPKDPLHITEIRVVGGEGDNLNFSIEPEADVILTFDLKDNTWGNNSSIVIDGDGELNFFKPGSNHTLYIYQGTKDNLTEGAVIGHDPFNDAPCAVFHVNGNLHIENYAGSIIESSGVVQLWDQTAHGIPHGGQNNFYVEGNLTGISHSYGPQKLYAGHGYAFLSMEGASGKIGGKTDIRMEADIWYGGLYGARIEPGNSAYETQMTFEDTATFHDIRVTAEGTKDRNDLGKKAFAGGILAASENAADDSIHVLTKIHLNGDAVIQDISAQMKMQSDDFSAYASGAEANGEKAEIYFNKGLQIRNISATVGENTVKSGASGEGAEAYSLSALNGGKIIVNGSGNTASVIQLENDILSYGKGGDGDASLVEVQFLNSNSHFIGLTPERPVNSQIPESEVGVTNLTFSDQAFWLVPKHNTLHGTLTLNDGLVYLGAEHNTRNGGTEPDFVTLKVDALNGSGGLIHMRTDIDLDVTDQLVVKQGTGAHSLMVRSLGTDPSKQAMDSFLVQQLDGDGSYALANAGGKVDVGTYLYTLEKRDSATEEGATEWYLVRTDKAPVTPPSTDDPVEPGKDPILSPSAEAVVAMAGMGAQNALYLSQLSDLRKRLGEIRGNVKDGLWASVAGQKDRISGFSGTGFKQDAYRFNLGFDKAVDGWILGGNFKYVTANQKTHDTNFRAKGDAHSEGFNLYAAWQNEVGCYADFVLSADHYHQRIKTNMLDGTPVKGSYHNWGFGVSAEGGKKMTFGEKNSPWFVEPQVQLSYYHLKGDNFAMSNDMRVKQKNFNSLTGRLGVNVGKDFTNAQGEQKGQVYAKAGVKHEFLGKGTLHVNNVKFKEDLLKTRFYYGAGTDWKVSKNLKVFGHVEREHGSRYTKEIEVLAGVKYSF